jgi:hypothetical protein
LTIPKALRIGSILKALYEGGYGHHNTIKMTLDLNNCMNNKDGKRYVSSPSVKEYRIFILVYMN